MAGSFLRQSVSGRALARIGAVVQEKYRIERLIGIGGMAAVYAATHRNGHRVAIKFLLDHLLREPDIYRLFSREAYVANQIGHSGAVPVLDDDVDEEGCPFLIMPLLEGETLRARWERANKHLPVAEVGVLMSDVLDVLASGHAKGIVHRDIKPENLFVTTKGDVRVLDFGIARRTDGDGSATLTGPMVGTPAFMPPEQALGERAAIGPHSDCWAVGATIFTLLSGEFVHRADSGGAQLAAAATRRARSLADVAANLPPSVVRFVDKGLAFDPPDRWRSAREMRDALHSAFEEALGEPLATVGNKIRITLAAELSPLSEDVSAKNTEPVSVARRNDTLVDGSLHVTDCGTASPLGHGPLSQPATKGNNAPPTLAAGMMATTTRGARRTWTLALAGAGVLVVAGFFTGALHWRKADRAEASTSPAGSLSADAANRSRASDNVAPPAEFDFHHTLPPTPEAINAYNAGVQAWRDASIELALEHFESATQLAPAFAAAHLRYALVSAWADTRSREHYQLAVRYRHFLSATDREMLEAYEPIVGIPANQREGERRLAALAVAHPSDLLILNLLAFARIRLGDQKSALEAIAPAIEADRSLAHSWRLKGLALMFEDRRDEAELTFKRCLEVAPSSTACLVKLSNLAANEGSCELALTYAVRLSAVARNSSVAALHLARATYATTGSPEKARLILEQSWSQLPNKRRAATQFQQETSLCLLTGDFKCTRKKLSEWGSAIAEAPDEESHIDHARTRIRVELETGNPNSAAATASDYLARRVTWEPHGFYDYVIEPQSALYLAGSQTRESYQRDRNAWLRNEASRESLVLDKGYRWIMAYAAAVRDERDAREALDVMHEYLPLPDTFSRTINTDHIVGVAYLLAGDVEKADTYLTRSANSCRALETPLEHMWATLDRGKLLERKGETHRACATYYKIIQRWSDRSSSSVRFARDRIQTLKCPSTLSDK